MCKYISITLFLFLIGNVNALEIQTEKLFLSKISKNIIQNDAKHTVIVSSPKELSQAVHQANSRGGNSLIKLKEGVYQLKKTLFIKKDQISIVALDSNPFNTVLSGLGMRRTKHVDNLFRISGSNFTLSGVTLQHVGNHLMQIAGESEANYPTIKNSVFQDGYEQLLKVTYNFNKPEHYSKGGLIENCLFRYTAGIGPNYYIGGIDAHAVQYWTIRNNIFESIASPSKHIAEHAIHIWNNAAYNSVENNIIINSDRGIGFGMRNGQKKNFRYGNLGGKINNNVIYHADNNHYYADAGITLEESPETNVSGNIILQENNYRSAIEYRFKSTSSVLITQNITNKGITKRDGADAILLDNIVNAKAVKKHLLEKLKVYIHE